MSCRVTDWKGANDRTTYTRYLPAWKKPITPPELKPSDYSARLDPLFKQEGSSRAETPHEDENELNRLTIVQLVPLSPDQYSSLSAAVGVTDIDQFVDAITKQGLEAFTERPGDLLDLADYWKSNGKFGSFAEMLEHSITRKLTEPDPHRPDNETISPEDAREGVERLAGALTLGKSLTLRAPGYDPDPSLAAGAVDPAEILPDWVEARRNARMARGNSIIAAAIISVVTVVLSAAAHAEDCLGSPHSAALEGTRWYYRLDPTNRRKCWYVRAFNQTTQEARGLCDTELIPRQAWLYHYRDHDLRLPNLRCR